MKSTLTTEAKVLKLSAQGKSDNDIAKALQLTIEELAEVWQRVRADSGISRRYEEVLQLKARHASPTGGWTAASPTWAKGIPALAWKSDASGSLQFVSDELAAWLGRSLPDVSKNGWKDAIHPEDLTVALRKESTWTQLRRNFEVVYRVRRSDGAYRWLINRGTPIFDASNELTGYLGVLTDSTELLETSSKLVESEARFRAMADSSPVMVWVAGEDKLCTFFNQAWLEFTGKSMDEELGDGWVNGVYRDDINRCMDTYVQHFDARKPIEMTYRLRRADGTYRWILDRGVPRYSRDGQFQGYIGSCTDVTEVLTLTEELQRYKSVVEASPDIFVMFNPEGRIEYANLAARSHLGLSPNSCLGSTQMSDLFAPDSLKVFEEESLPMAVETGNFVCEANFASNSGRLIPMSISILVHRDERGIIQHVSIHAKDISQLKNTQGFIEHVANLTDQVLYLIDVESLDVVFCSRDISPELEYKNHNPALENLALLEEVIHPEDRESFSQFIERLPILADGEVIDLTMRLMSEGQQPHWFRGRTTVFERNVNGTVKLALGVAVDDTQMFEYGDQLQAETQRNRELSQQVRELTSELEALRSDHAHQMASGLAEKSNGYTSFMNCLETEIARSARYGNPLSLALLDLTDFKDTARVYGRDKAEDALSAFTKILNVTIRQNDMLARISAEEFAVILTETNAAGAAKFCKRIHQALLEFGWNGLPLTCVSGCASLKPGQGKEDLYTSAEKKLHQNLRKAGRPLVH